MERISADDLNFVVFDPVGAAEQYNWKPNTRRSPSRNKLKTTLQAIKHAAWEYADGDASLRSRIEGLLDQDRQRAGRMRGAGARAEA